MNPAQGGWIILLSILVAMILAIVHLPESLPQWLGWLRPAWVPMLVFFWVTELPHRIGLISAWLVGLLLDVLIAQPLGLNGLLLATITYVAWRFYERLRMYSVLQQSGVLFIVLLFSEVLRMWAQDLVWDRGWSGMLFLPALTSALLWPFLYIFLQQLRIRFRVE